MTRSQFLMLATVFQGGLALLGFGLARWQHVPLSWRWTLASVAAGVVLTIPMLLFLWWAVKSNWSPLRSLRDTLIHRFGPILRLCSPVDLLYLSVLAGASEEILFRGGIQNSLLGWGLLTAIVVTNLLFGLCHAASMVYFCYAFLAGCYLSWVAGIPDQNLAPAITAHAFYDFIALAVIRHLAATPDGSISVDLSRPPEESHDPESGFQEISES